MPPSRHCPMTSRPRPAEGSKPSFKDVKAGAWYTGWINAAESLNLVQGDGNGTFRPN
ncbi:MAG: S-layer homology domain-containing protein, partial [Firmicutes bacterium]|nr:S-layer homology domain-containing protein [Bacillota bacterium]